MLYRVYLSSTLKDLEPERRAVQDALADQCVVKHSYGASESDLVESCLADVEQCQMYILILGLRYGHVPGRPFKNPKKRSITELEYRHAGASEIPRLVYLKDESVIPITSADLRTKEHPPERIETFRALAGREQKPALFKDVPSLRERVLKDFTDLKARIEKARTRNVRKRGAGRRPSIEDVRERYIAWLRGECEKVVLLGLGARDGQYVRLGQVIVPALTVRERKELAGAGRTRRQAGLEDTHEPLLHRLGRESLFVPGPPGSGKSTFCRWVALAAATGDVASRGLPRELTETMPDGLRGRFPFLCQLRQWASDGRWLAGNGHWTRAQLERSLADWIDATKPGGLTRAAFAGSLERGSCLLVFDGVDEIPDRREGHYPRRNFLTGLADALPQWTKRHRVLLTSRPYGVEDADRRRVGLAQAELAPLPRVLQDVFVRRWYAAANAPDAAAKARGLIEHLDERQDLDDLRPNPMLLTALCVKYDENLRLPGDMYRLYDEVTDQVLYKRSATEPERDVVRLRLSAVALAMHRGLPGRPRATPEAEVSLDDVDEALVELTRTDKASEQAGVEASERREDLLSSSGLLLPRPNKRAAFYHFSFQEFLAAVRLHRVTGDARAVLAERKSVPEWRRTLRFLFCAIADRKSPEQALDALAVLLEDLKPEALERDVNPALLLADCLEIGHARRWNLDAFATPYRQACGDALARVAPPARAHLWRVLGRVGLDDRAGVGVRDGVPDVAWIDVPAGPFQFGGDRRVMTLPAFRIARYPVTNAQFEAFIADGGFEEKTWWRWPRFREPPVRPAFPYPNHPRERVSWFDAKAFCAWLENRLRGRGDLSAGQTVRLPTEEEWEKAARGGDGRDFPWEGPYESGRANVDETWSKVGPFYLQQTSAVGIYPGGRSPYGVDDLAGNVWERCEATSEAAVMRPDAPRVLRGGCWGAPPDRARAAYRIGGLPPGPRFDSVGFRVVCVSPIA